jgi:hypothetical protein
MTEQQNVESVLDHLTLSLAGQTTAESLRTLLALDLALHDLTTHTARSLADQESWRAVAEVTGRSREAAWQRWH